MKKKTNYMLLLLTWLLVGTACDSLLDTKSDSLLPQDNFQTAAGCEAFFIGASDFIQRTTY